MMSSTEIRKSRRNLILLFSIFIVPVVMAKLALENDWFEKASTNSGELLQQEMSIADLDFQNKALEMKWLIIYRLPSPCDENCKQTIYGINQTFISLGREMDRVIPVGLYTPDLNTSELGALKEKFWTFDQLTAASRERLESNQVYVSDPLGNVILKYPAPSTDDEVLSMGKAMLSDLRKLLKYSRVG